MAKTAINELQRQIEQVRREAFAAGYAAAMQTIRELASRPPASAGPAAAPRSRRGALEPKRAATMSSRGRQRGGRRGAVRPRRSAGSRPQRGSNAQSIGEVLQAAAPRAMRPAEIRKALQDKGIEMAFTSIRHALGQLEERNAAEQVGNAKNWRHRAAS